ncbi:hypothetical protein ARSEF4850_009781, partial [Beauveria asiatica]
MAPLAAQRAAPRRSKVYALWRLTVALFFYTRLRALDLTLSHQVLGNARFPY